MKIRLLWPTVRPETMMDTHQFWVKKANKPQQIATYIAVNTKEQIEPLKKITDYLYVCGDDIKGVAFPSYVLASKLKAHPQDIVILASDDFFPPQNWDTYLKKEFQNFNGCLLVNDGYQYGQCVTLPIMTFECLIKLKRIIYHPVYYHLWSDNELYVNLKNMNLLKDQRKQSPLFEHKHYDAKKRCRDKYDKIAHAYSNQAFKTYQERMKLPLIERLKLDSDWVKLVRKIK
jgi:hypothetical protein